MSLPQLVKLREHNFYSKTVVERVNLVDDPLVYCINIVTRYNAAFSEIIGETGSRCVVYHAINPEFTVQMAYRDRHTVNNRYRMSFTRLYVSGHRLSIETGRWNRRGRGWLPRAECHCVCGNVQTEKHVEEFQASSDIRDSVILTNKNYSFNETHSHEESFMIIRDILKLYK